MDPWIVLLSPKVIGSDLAPETSTNCLLLLMKDFSWFIAFSERPIHFNFSNRISCFTISKAC